MKIEEKLDEYLIEKVTDMTGKKCQSCGKGKYKETSMHDDMDGVLHCDKCGAEIKRYSGVQKPDPQKKKAFDEYNKFQKEATNLLKIFKVKLRNHQNRFFGEKELNLNYVDDIKYLVGQLKSLKIYFE
ncbi:MAG TPA: hypothetical protein VMZ91_06340 [Candidatus Paceibacterota bacterium]|nr:hypothetical protein [Candidatus Paceibacterota bacterium]